MLEIKNICKQYKTGSFIQHALKDVSLNLRDNEFVSILGPSGSGKTTLLNIIGGLDQYDSGDIIINNVSTKSYKDRDWDSYRAHSVGFIFQSYNLIPHQTLLRNVEIALRISNVPSKERKQRAKEALEKVGLGQHINKKPNQLSGGQMQRVAIARALVNNPKIILADEPTGALDTKTSVQVMELLKEVAKDRLVVMVTHNPELAHQYSTRIVELRDGVLQSDSNPYEVEKDENVKVSHRSFGKVGMSLLTSMRLSCSNLWSKIKRTTLVAVAGSIGIIGISLIMSISNGSNAYIQSLEEQTLSEYPLTISKSTMDLTSLMGVAQTITGETTDDLIHEQTIISSMFGTVQENNLKDFKEYIEGDASHIRDYVNAIEYNYGLTPYIYAIQNNKARQVSPDNIIESAGLSTIASLMAGQNTTFAPLPADESIYKSKYELAEGRWPENPHELVVVLGPGNTLSDLALYNMGLKDTNKLDAMIKSYTQGSTENQLDTEPEAFPFTDVIDKQFHLVNAAHMYKYDEQTECWIKISEENEVQTMAKNGEVLTIVGVARPNAENDNPTMTPAIYYPAELVYEMIETSAESPIVKAQLADMNTNVFTGKSFDDESTDFDISKLFNFDEEAFDDIFAFDSETVEMDMSGFNSLNIGNFNIGNYINQDLITELFGTITEDAIEDLFEGVTVDITREKLNDLFIDLYKDFLESTDNAHNMNIENMGPAISKYLSTDAAKQIIKDTIMKYMENGKDVILSSSEFTAQGGKFIIAYINWCASNELDPADQTNISSFMATGEATAITNAMADAAANALAQMLTSTEFSEELVTKLAEGYDVWAEANNEPIAKVIADAFGDYLGTDRAFDIIMEHAGRMIDMEKLEENFNNVAASVGKDISKVINSHLSAAVSALGYQLGIQIKNAVTTAMTSYMEELKNSFDFSTESWMEVVDANISMENMSDILSNMLSGAQQTAKTNLKSFGYAKLEDPESITFYPKDFESKAGVIDVLETYNELMLKLDREDDMITYSDMVGSLMSSITDIIDIIGYVLIAFVSVSLVVSSIMIGVITYISVLERKKEIGILRAMGASKRNITEVFNCETIITGFLAGLIGVVMTWLILIPANAILQYVTGQPNLRGFLPVDTAMLLVLLSMTLTTIGGLLPSKSAAKQDPVIALRAE